MPDVSIRTSSLMRKIARGDSIVAHDVKAVQKIVMNYHGNDEDRIAAEVEHDRVPALNPAFESRVRHAICALGRGEEEGNLLATHGRFVMQEARIRMAKRNTR